MFQAPVSRLATTAALAAALGAACAAVAGPLYRVRWIELEPAMVMVVSGAAAAVVALLLAVPGFLATLGLHGKRGRGRALLALLLGGAVVTVTAPHFYAAFTLPAIHDVSTDLDNPPAFDALAAARARGDNPLEHPGEKVAEKQRQAYPEIEARYYSHNVADLLAAAQQVAWSQGWTVARTDEQGGLEAAARSDWFAFVDDVAVRIRDEGPGERRVDVRSASRVGQHDLGANARRIKAFFAELEAVLDE